MFRDPQLDIYTQFYHPNCDFRTNGIGELDRRISLQEFGQKKGPSPLRHRNSVAGLHLIGRKLCKLQAFWLVEIRWCKKEMNAGDELRLQEDSKRRKVDVPLFFFFVSFFVLFHIILYFFSFVSFSLFFFLSLFFFVFFFFSSLLVFYLGCIFTKRLGFTFLFSLWTILLHYTKKLYSWLILVIKIKWT